MITAVFTRFAGRLNAMAALSQSFGAGQDKWEIMRHIAVNAGGKFSSPALSMRLMAWANWFTFVWWQCFGYITLHIGDKCADSGFTQPFLTSFTFVHAAKGRLV